MALGILSGRAVGHRALSGEPPPAPWCWDYPGFKDCHQRSWKGCDGKNYELKLAGKPQMTKAEFDDCVYTRDNMDCDCPALDPKRSSTTSSTVTSASSSGLVFGNTTPNAQTQSLQRDVNALLTAHGMAAISTDGKLGAGTCGAARFADRTFGSTLMSKYGLTSVCKSFTEPRAPVSVAAPTVVSSSSASAVRPSALEPAEASIITPRNLVIAAAVAAGAWFFFGRKKTA
jgi:hypothetical protein